MRWLKECEHVLCCLFEIIVFECWELNGGREQIRWLGNVSCCVRRWDVALEATVMFHGWADVEAWDSVLCPGVALLRCCMNEDFCTWNCQWCFVEVEGSKEAVVGRK